MLAAIRRASSLLSQLGLKCLLYPQKRTSELNHAMSALCQKQTYAVQQSTSVAIAGIGEFSPAIGGD